MYCEWLRRKASDWQGKGFMYTSVRACASSNKILIESWIPHGTSHCTGLSSTACKPEKIFSRDTSNTVSALVQIRASLGVLENLTMNNVASRSFDEPDGFWVPALRTEGRNNGGIRGFHCIWRSLSCRCFEYGSNVCKDFRGA
jgi:hypothetical protein